MRAAAGLLLGIAVAVQEGATGQRGTPRTQEGGQPGKTPGEGPLREDEKIVHLLNRLTPGATPRLVAEVREVGIQKWLQRQLQGNLPEPDSLISRVAKLETLKLDDDQRAEMYFRKENKLPTQELLAWVVFRAIYGANHVRETMSDFFRNHFTVSIDKDLVQELVIDWERNVIEKSSLGRFGDMLTASAHHPAMLFYLDNHYSRRPATEQELKELVARVLQDTRSKERAKEATDLERQLGLNENYARELLELHTLGVDRFYRQQDVIEVARCLTGWTIRRTKHGAHEFHFNEKMHARGDKLFLGYLIKERHRDLIQEGEEVLSILRQHKGTAAFLSWKLCRWLVNDDPDEKMVERVAKAWRTREGNIAKVLEAIVEDPKFFARENFRTKFKRPWEFVISALRVTGAEVTHVGGILERLAQMNEPLYRCADPTGYYDQAEAWRDPGALAYRWLFATHLVSGGIPGVKIPLSFYQDLPPDKPGEWLWILSSKILPVTDISAETAAGIARLVERERKRRPKAAPREIGALIVAALLGSPDFQKQ